MAFRETHTEIIYPDSYIIYDSQSGKNETKSDSTIKINATYNCAYGERAPAIYYESIEFDSNSILNQSNYKEQYSGSIDGVYVNVTNLYPKVEDSDPYPEVYYIEWALLNPGVPYRNMHAGAIEERYVLGTRNLYLDNKYSVHITTYNERAINLTAYVTINGIGSGGNSPRSTVYWKRCDPQIKDILPVSGSFVDDLNGFRISWTLDAPASAAGNVFMPTDIQFQWGSTQSLGNTITLTLDPNNPDSYRGVDIPPNTFPTSGTVYWKIRWKSELENTYWETDLGTYSTTDSTAVVTPTYPVNASIDGEVDNVFQWEYESDTGLPQFAFDFQYSNNDGLSWENLFQHQESTSPSCTVPANTFIAGNGLWKVRGYNTDDVAGEWSQQASIIVRAASKPPVISSVTTTPKVMITWQASGQQAFRLTAKNSTETYESGIVFGTGKTFIIPHYWDDGELQIAISIENRFGVWSDEATTAVIIQNTPSGNISLNGYVEDYGAVLSWRTDTTFKAFYVLRDGIAIACVTDTSYVDRNICGDAVYRVMGVTENGNYTESEALNLYSAPEHAVVGLVDGDDWVELRVNRSGMPEITETHMEDISYQYYSGRMYPVAYSSMFRERTKTFGFTVWKDAAEKLGELIGQLVILKDYTSGKIVGVLNNLQLSGYVRRPDVSFDITVIDYSEEVSFDV